MMFIEFTFVVNGYNLKKSTISVTYTAVDETLGLKPHIIQQLGVERDILPSYQAGEMTVDVLKEVLRKAIIGAGSRAQYEWNIEIATRGADMPAELVPLFGIEWEAVTEAEVTGNTEVII